MFDDKNKNKKTKDDKKKIPTVVRLPVKYASEVKPEEGQLNNDYTPRPTDAPQGSLPPLVRKNDVSMMPVPGEKKDETKATNVPSVSTYQARRAEIERRRQELDNRRAENEKPVEDKNGRLKSGLSGMIQNLADAYSLKNGIVRNWDEFFARAASGLGGFAGGMINPKADEEIQQQTNRVRLDKDFKALNDEEDQFYDSAKRDADINYQNARPQLERDEMASRERIAGQNNSTREAIANQRIQAVIEREQRKAAAEGNKFSLKWEDGVLKRVYKDPTKNAETVLDDDGTPVVNKVNVPVNVNGFDVTGKDGLMSQTNFNNNSFDAEESYQKELSNYNQRQSQINGQLQGARVELQTVESQIKALEEKVANNTAYDSDLQQLNSLKKSHADLSGKIQQFQSQLQQNRPPVRVARPPAPVVTQGKYSGMTFQNPQSLRQFFPNMSDEQIRNIVMSQGGRFQQ